MSSSNLVRLAYIKESVYNEAPTTGDLTTMRFTSESVNGAPNTVESEELRSDRQSAGQITANIAVEGSIEFEPAGSNCYKDWIESAMKSAWMAAVSSAASQLDIDATAGTITDTGATNDFTTLYAAGDMLKLSGFTDAANEEMFVYVTAVTATVLTIQGKGLVDETGDGDEVLTRPEKIEVGQDTTSFTVEKEFTDLTDKTILYSGVLANEMELGFTYGEIASGSFGLMGANYTQPMVPYSDGRIIAEATTELPLNASSDVGFVLIDNAITDFCVQSLGVNLNNNERPRECVGNLTPQGMTPGTAAVEVNMEAYLADENFGYIQNKIDSTPIEIFYFAENDHGGIGVQMPAAQLTFDDPASGGRDEDVMLSMTGTAKAPADGRSSLIIYWL
jgi:hypothetical protein